MILAVALIALQPVAPRLAVDLRPGLELHYTSQARETPAWVVDSVMRGEALMVDADCARFFIRRSPEQPSSETRLCVGRDTLFGWDARRSTWIAQRPVGARMTLVLPRASGDTVRYTTEGMSYETISGVRVQVVATTVLTVDSLGRSRRRLRERYALSLATATGGVFETADTATGTWRTEQSFELRRLSPPPNR
jgi:hypothetical protein